MRRKDPFPRGRKPLSLEDGAGRPGTQSAVRAQARFQEPQTQGSRSAFEAGAPNAPASVQGAPGRGLWRTCAGVRRRRMALVFFVRRSRGRYFFFENASRRLAFCVWLITVST